MNSDVTRENAESGLYIGLMSGTSLDGVDAVLADFGTPPPKLRAAYYLPYPRELSERLLSLHKAEFDELHQSALIGNEITHLFHRAVETLLDQSGVDVESVCAVGCHGQTIRHNPKDGYTVQLGNPSLLAELCNIRVVADFRSRDVAAGGQGAPLVPAFHEAAFRLPSAHRVILNVGGIANVTNLRPGTPTEGFDTGPGNMLLDAWVKKQTGKAFDEGGDWASGGHPIPSLLESLLDHPFFSTAPPKSCGREQFNIEWIEDFLLGSKPAQDVQATLLELSAKSIVNAIDRWCGNPDELVICGGGARNAFLVHRLTELLPQTSVMTSCALGIGSDWVEAMAFAWLARQALLGLPGNMPSVTGAKGERILGAVYPR